MSRGKSSESSCAMLELWRPPADAGGPIGCLATTYTFTPGLFDEQCLARFLEIESDPNREDLAFLLEREGRLGSVYAGVMVDHTQAGVEHSLRWDILPVRIPGGRQHAKLSVLAWSNHIRIIVASANLTEPGYRTNHEVAATIDLSPKEADRELLAQAVAFLRDLLTFVPRGRESTPEVQRADTYLAHVERQAGAWARPRSKGRVRQKFACTLPAAPSGQEGRSSLEEALAICRRRGGSPYEAWIASPFFDADEDMSRVAAALCRLMARGRSREVCFCVPAVLEDGEPAVPRLAAPKAIASTPLKYRGSVTVEILPDFDEDENRRPWHAKMLALLGDTYSALLVGSSNFTSAGMGVTSHRNAEANLVTVAERVAFGREAGNLEAIWPQMEPVDDLDEAEWLGPQRNHDEEENEPGALVPVGILSATYRAGDERQIVVFLVPELLPPEWRIYACGRDERELLNQWSWSDMGSPEAVSLNWPPLQPPDRLLISWDGLEAFLPLNVEDPQQLPPPAELEQMSAADMLWLLAAPDPSAAFRAWARGQQASDTFDTDLDSATPSDLDPLRRHDLQSTFLHRIRRRARMLAQLRSNLQRPVWGRQALEWRLRGMIGIETFAERLVRELDSTDGSADEGLLTLADFLIVLREVDYQPSDDSLTKPEFEEVFRPFLRELAEKLQGQLAARNANVSADLMGFWQRVLEQCR